MYHFVNSDFKTGFSNAMLFAKRFISAAIELTRAIRQNEDFSYHQSREVEQHGIRFLAAPLNG
jgi:hypothetical protein